MAAHPNTPPFAAHARRHANRPASGDSGLIALEWLLIVGLIAGLAASTVLIVQQVVDDTSEARPDPLARLVEADVAAAFIASDAQAAFNQSLIGPPPYDNMPFFERCRLGIEGDFDDVVDSASWTAPADPNNTPSNLDDDVSAECDILPFASLDGS